MAYFTDRSEFDKEMTKVLAILERKGFVVESDHPYAYSMQHGAAFTEVSEWLERSGYGGNLDTHGYFDYDAGAVYGMYDKNRVSYERMHKELIKETQRQAKRAQPEEE